MPIAKRSDKDALQALRPARRLLDVIAGLTPDDSGSFLDHHGKVVPW